MKTLRSRWFSWPSITLFLGAGAVAWQMSSSAAEPAVMVAPPVVDNAKAPGKLQTAVLSGGCFWGVQGVYEHVRGVRNVLSGYAGGSRGTADYETVSTGTTGHAESVQIIFDPAVVSYGELLQVFFSVAHDPTQLNHQGFDRGTQYRSAIFFQDESQKRIAAAYIEQLNQSKVFAKPIVTRIDPLKGFYKAEAYHQDYLINNPNDGYIVWNDLPKIENLKKMLPGYYRPQAVTVGELALR